jgi:hypothetical protein
LHLQARYVVIDVGAWSFWGHCLQIGSKLTKMKLAALVSCLGQGPCFSKIAYMVTVCKYSTGLYSIVGYCAFFEFTFMVNLGSIPAGDIFFHFKDK